MFWSTYGKYTYTEDPQIDLDGFLVVKVKGSADQQALARRSSNCAAMGMENM